MQCLRDVTFTDLFLESELTNARIRGFARSPDLQAIPEILRDDVRRLYNQVNSTHSQAGEALEFAVLFDEVMYRVTVIPDVRGRVFALRRGAVHLPPFDEIGIAPAIVDKLRKLQSGLVLFSGAFSAGKTTAASAYVIERTTAGGLSLTLEDPPELPLSGDHGKGRCLQVRMERDKIEAAIESTLRMSFDMLFVSEIRTPRIAAELVNASVNGKLTVSTIHADGAISAVSRLAALASAGAGLANESNTQVGIVREMLANGLAVVIHMSKISEDHRAATEYLLGTQDLKAKVIAGEFAALQNSINLLKNRLAHGQRLEG